MSVNNVVVIGSCMIDFVSYAPRLPKAGETVHGHQFATNFGGKGANQCVAVAKLGGKVSFLARVGDDIWGPKYLENLQKLQVDTTYVQTTKSTTTGIAQIIVSETGENQIVIVAGANNNLNVKDVDAAEDLIKTADVIVLQLETSEDVAIRALQLCKGISILNAAPAPLLYNDNVLKLPTIFCVNETEAAVFSELPVSDTSEAEIAASALLDKGCNSVLITLGKLGAVYADRQQSFHVNCPSVQCVDSTGAGDAFVGAVAYLLANNKELSMREIIEKACLVASDSVTRRGTQKSFPGPSILQ